MVSQKTEALTAQFYEWEILGRGWLSADEPVDLEPPFTPFFGHFLKGGPVTDDGLRHTWLSSIASAFKNKPPIKVLEEKSTISYDLYPYTDSTELQTLQLHISKHAKINGQEIEQLLTMLSYCTRPISFEIIGTASTVKLQFVCRQEDALYIKSQLASFLKGVSVSECETEEKILLENTPFATIDFGLKEEFMRPVGQSKSSMYTLSSLFSILDYLKEDEQVIFQVLFNGVMNHWESSIIKSVSDAKGGAFFEDAPEMLPLAKDKVNSMLFAATIRLVAQAPTLDESFSLVQKISFALITNSKSQSNSLMALPDEVYSAEERVMDIMYRESHRAGMLLNAKELATFIHIPDLSLVSKKVLGDTKKTKSASNITEGHDLVLGTNAHNGITKKVTISNTQRLKHSHIIGATGTGKSTLLHSMICQDIENGKGLTVLDPHGDLVDAVLKYIPESRMKDVILIDPADSEFPVAFNILKAHSDIEKEVLSSDLVAAFRRLSTSWGDQMNSVFANAILAFLESTKGGTLIDLRRFLIERPFREQFLKTINDPCINYYWQKEYPLLKTNSIGPILTRLDAFLRPRLIRNMVAQPKGIDFEKVLNTRKILLVKLSQGLIGTENSYLLGTFVVSKIHQAALARQAQDKRNDFFVYIDEFQHFTTPSMAHILSGARKYHVGLILAHQDLQQLQKSDAELLNTLITNAGTRICFRLGDTDAKRMAEGFSFFDVTDLQNLNTGEVIARIERPEFDFSLSTIPFEADAEKQAKKELIIEHSRSVYNTPKHVVEEMLRESMGFAEDSEKEEQVEIKPVRQTPLKEEQKIIPVPEPQKIVEPFQPDEKEIASVIKKKVETQHRYLQTLIKKMAESKGYKATIEMPTPDGKGKVDVSLVKGTEKIAVEVSVTTEVDWEIHNLQKCIDAGYTIVFMCTQDNKFKKLLQDKVDQLFDKTQQEKIMIGVPEELFQLLDIKSVKELTSETKVKGYRVKVEYENLSDTEMKRKRDSIAKVISDSMKKMKK